MWGADGIDGVEPGNPSGPPYQVLCTLHDSEELLLSWARLAVIGTSVTLHARVMTARVPASYES